MEHCRIGKRVESAELHWRRVFRLINLIHADRDSPNKLPIFDILQIGAWTDLQRAPAGSGVAEKYFDALKYLLSLGLSPEGVDVAGYTALQHSLTCTPLLYDLKWSQILLDASAEPISAINHRNRYGGTAAHEVMQSFKRPGEEAIRLKVLKYLLDHGANVDSELDSPARLCSR